MMNSKFFIDFYRFDIPPEVRLTAVVFPFLEALQGRLCREVHLFEAHLESKLSCCLADKKCVFGMLHHLPGNTDGVFHSFHAGHSSDPVTRSVHDLNVKLVTSASP